MRFFFFTICLSLVLVNGISNAQTLQPGFTDQIYMGGWNNAQGFAFDQNKFMYVWEKAGRVWIVDSSGIKLPNPLINIAHEVGNFGDNGLVGFALDPDFLNNHYIYLYYTVDRYHLLNAGLPTYDSTQSLNNQATIMRVTRYTCDSATNYTSVNHASRFVLLGETKYTGIPVLDSDHNGGSLVFGNDSSLLISTGDGGSGTTADTGSVSGTYWFQALNDSIIRPAENVGAFRSLLMNSYSGKILRIDAKTGSGLNSNPYFEVGNPGSITSKIFALGLQNPHRFCVKPNTGSTDITAGDPGVIMLGDFGFGSWESFFIVQNPGLNFGWPVFEGLTKNLAFGSKPIENTDTPNPLFGTGGCTQPFFYFSNLVTLDYFPPDYFYPNSCDSMQAIPSSAFPMNHKRPDLEWKHNQYVTRCPSHSGQGTPVSIETNLPNAPVQADMFAGGGSIGGTFFEGKQYPAAYQNSYFHGDFAEGWIKQFVLNNNNQLTSVNAFGENLGQVVFIGSNPRNNCLMYINYPSEIHQICFTAYLNNPPVAIAQADTFYTPADTLTVQFTGSNSSDPENGPLQYEWNFGDGSPVSNLANPVHTFTNPFTNPLVRNVTLTVTDDTLQTGSTSINIHLTNSPPQINITSPQQGYLYSMLSQTVLPLTAVVSDAQSIDAQLNYHWQLALHHNNHTHSYPIDTAHSTVTTIDPVGCDTLETYFYRINLKVSDPQGLFSTAYTDIYPACLTSSNINLHQYEGLSAYIYPNPATGNDIMISIKNANASTDDVAIEITNLLGKRVLYKQLSDVNLHAGINYPLSTNVAPGMYLVKVVNDNKTFAFKFLLQ